jgi:hypothetical protein
MIYEFTPYQTTDATPVNAFKFMLLDGFGGMMVVDIIGVADDGSGAVSGRLIVNLMKFSTLTMGTPTVVHSDTSFASFALVNDSENLAVEITGHATKTVIWIVKIELLTTNASATP